MRAPFFSPYPFYYALFRRRADGEWDFFPYLRWGRGYRANAMQRTDLIDSMLRYDLALAVATSIVLALSALALTHFLGSEGTAHEVADALSFVLFMGALGIVFVLRFRNIRRMVTNLPPAETALKAADEYALWAVQLPKPAILLMMVLGSVGCIGAIAGLFHVLGSGEWGGSASSGRHRRGVRCRSVVLHPDLAISREITMTSFSRWLLLLDSLVKRRIDVFCFRVRACVLAADRRVPRVLC